MNHTDNSATSLAAICPPIPTADARLPYEAPTLSRLLLTEVVAGASGNVEDIDGGGQLG